MKKFTGLAALTLTLALGGCMALAGRGAKELLGGREKSASDKLTAAQEAAITGAHGGTAGIPIFWTEKNSGLQGALTPENEEISSNGCRNYRLTLAIGPEDLDGRIAACLQSGGSWKITPAPPAAKP